MNGRKLISIARRYLLPLVAFALILLISYVFRQYLSINLDLTSLVIVLMIAAAWYFGIGPGLLMAVVFEAVILLLSPSPKSVFITINRMVLFVSVVLFAGLRRDAERRLREQRELLQVTLSSIGDAVIAADTNGQINFINPTAETLTGWTAAEAVGKPLDEVFQIVGEETRESIENPFATIKRDGLVVGLSDHTALIARDKTKIPIETSGAPIKDTDGSIIGVVIVFYDVSERRQTEQERERLLESEQAARKEAETANRLKDDFLATVSHELRSPLSAILGWSAMLNKGKMEEATVRDALGIIERNARAQAAIVNDILDVSRIITGKLHIDSQPVAIAPLIRESVETARPAAIAKSIMLRVSLDEIQGTVIGDSNRLRQIVWNLISNAVKFTPENGQVEISLKKVDSHAVIKVSDNGAGIDEEFLPFVFERFRQSDSSTTRAQGGLGLGLSIVRHLVELHGGTVTAESAGEKRGATFIVSLPLSEKSDNAVLPESNLTIETGIFDELSPNAPDIRGVRILVVDDDTDTLEVLRVVLKQYGARVRIAVSCADALEVFREWKPDVLISDLAMPVEDGYALIGKIRALSPEQGGNIPAAALTAYVAETDRRKALSAGYQIHIAKPVDPTVIAAAVEKIKKRL